MDKDIIYTHPIRRAGLRRMRLILALCLLDVVPAILVILAYLGISLPQLVNITQLFIFFGIATLTRSLTLRSLPFLMFAITLLAISGLKSIFNFDYEDINFDASAVFPYLYSLVMPPIIFSSIYSQKNATGREILQELRWFSKWFVIVSFPIMGAYIALHYTGRIAYFGFGINFPYAAPYFFHRTGFVVLFITIILLSGKRAVLVNFIIQWVIYSIGELRRSPIKMIFLLCLAILFIISALPYLEFFLRRFFLMTSVWSNSGSGFDFLSMSGSYESVAMFSGRLEEIAGVISYYKQHPAQFWFGSPPGANFLWEIDYAGYTEFKSYAHLTWAGYVFRFGAVPTSLLLVTLIAKLVAGWDAKNPLFLVYVAILSGATFGGNLFYSPVPWAMIALYFRYGKAISQEIRHECHGSAKP